MNYLQLVNGVLSRMREDTVTTVQSSGDVVVDIVADLVNDAKQLVEDSHDWNALRYSWPVTTADGTSTYTLADSAERVTVEYVLHDDGGYVDNRTLQYIRSRKATTSNATERPIAYAFNGAAANGDKKIELYPTPNAAYNIEAHGFKGQPALSSDTDVLLVPSKPVLYWALSLAARERGEVGGQTAAELFSMAQTFMSDAIARDSALNPLDDIWMVM
jgi:hypothetical protein